MSDAIEIRAATAADAQGLCALEARSWSLRSAPIQVDGASWLRPEASFEGTLVSVHQGEIIGCISLARAFPERLISADHVVRIKGILVAPEHRGKRVGGRLLDAADAYARAKGYRKIVLQALGTNASAHRMYERHGFVREGCVTRCFFLEGQWVDDYHFGKWLS